MSDKGRTDNQVISEWLTEIISPCESNQGGGIDMNYECICDKSVMGACNMRECKDDVCPTNQAATELLEAVDYINNMKSGIILNQNFAACHVVKHDDMNKLKAAANKLRDSLKGDRG